MDDRNERVILVDADDREIGTAGKLEAHRAGSLHRAFSVIVWNGAGEMLLQRRALTKYHSGGLWTNACCGHPRPGEPVEAAAARRLQEELGFTCALEPLGALSYHAPLDQGLTEHELVHVFRGVYDGDVRPDPAEADAVNWMSEPSLQAEMSARPNAFTVWFVKYMRAGWPLERLSVA